ncbi:hypothetical protein [Natronobacterium texcoconense]|uniref:Uncharacterized protein n=1 Tax=Natronobacterium texcoconense TaxID=1095778 RepID=A0A1H1G0Y5_NATTX|nr:hypothetical protein [Natronobacterium texcoconense]SDR06568.1 hypothetical protein SAMN04489842_2195 [Natronobacterium texcoconense]
MSDSNHGVLRRVILATVGTVSAGAVGASSVGADHEDQTYPYDYDEEPNYHDDVDIEEISEADDSKEVVCTRSCDDSELDRDACPECEEWSAGVLTAYNCTERPARLYLSTTGPNSHDHCLDERNVELLDSETEITLESGERQSIWFRGSIRQMAVEEGDINIGIAQRSAEESMDCSG